MAKVKGVPALGALTNITDEGSIWQAALAAHGRDPQYLRYRNWQTGYERLYFVGAWSEFAEVVADEMHCSTYAVMAEYKPQTRRIYGAPRELYLISGRVQWHRLARITPDSQVTPMADRVTTDDVDIVLTMMTLERRLVAASQR